MSAVTPFLWYDSQAEEAVDFYLSVFPDSSKDAVIRYNEAGPGAPGSVMTVEFHLRGQRFVALNGGPVFTFNPAVSFVIDCETQDEADHYWYKLAEGGVHSMCGWLTDRYGVSWQVVPTMFERLYTQGGAGAVRMTEAMLKMDRLVIDELQRAFDGEG